MNLLPCTQMQPSISNGHCYLLAKHLTLKMSISIVLSGAVMVIFLSICRSLIKWSNLFEPFHDIMMQSILEVVDVTRSSNVHGIDQNQAIRDTAFSNYFLNITSDATNFISFFRVYPNFFDISCGLASNEFFPCCGKTIGGC